VGCLARRVFCAGDRHAPRVDRRQRVRADGGGAKARRRQWRRRAPSRNGPPRAERDARGGHATPRSPLPFPLAAAVRPRGGCNPPAVVARDWGRPSRQPRCPQLGTDWLDARTQPWGLSHCAALRAAGGREGCGWNRRVPWREGPSELHRLANPSACMPPRLGGGPAPSQTEPCTHRGTQCGPALRAGAWSLTAQEGVWDGDRGTGRCDPGRDSCGGVPGRLQWGGRARGRRGTSTPPRKGWAGRGRGERVEASIWQPHEGERLRRAGFEGQLAHACLTRIAGGAANKGGSGPRRARPKRLWRDFLGTGAPTERGGRRSCRGPRPPAGLPARPVSSRWWSFQTRAAGETPATFPPPRQDATRVLSLVSWNNSSRDTVAEPWAIASQQSAAVPLTRFVRLVWVSRHPGRFTCAGIVGHPSRPSTTTTQGLLSTITTIVCTTNLETGPVCDRSWYLQP